MQRNAIFIRATAVRITLLFSFVVWILSRINARRRTTARLTAPQAYGEWDLARQSARLTRVGRATWLTGSACGLPVTIGAASMVAPPPRFAAGCYKLDAASTAALRSNGWTVAKISKEAIISPQTWTTKGKTRMSLRRKLRRATNASIRITHPTRDFPIAQMTEIAAEWARRQGGERGFSMGWYDPVYVARQEVFLIWQRDTLIGFVSFQNHGRSWHLDLMRMRSNAPSGAMQCAIVAAIDAAKQCAVEKFSLAAVYDCPLQTQSFAGAKNVATGLFQFKNSFGPKWRPLYHAAPNKLMFALSILAVTLAIQRPFSRLSRCTLARIMKLQA